MIFIGSYFTGVFSTIAATISGLLIIILGIVLCMMTTLLWNIFV